MFTTPPLRYCGNISFLFTDDVPFTQRYRMAHELGFRYVESAFPIGLKATDVVEARRNASVEHVLMNVYPGDTTKGELGFAALPDREEDFLESLRISVEYAKTLGVKKLHIMAGNCPSEPFRHNDAMYLRNISYAAKVLEKEQIIGLIEPICPQAAPNYYLRTYDQAVDVIRHINSPNLKLMLDIFHLQQIAGNLTQNISKYMKYTGHVQIAQVPGRHEMDTPGEINFHYILEQIRRAGYTDFVGLEYKPIGSVKDGLNWIREYGFTL